MQRRIIVYQKNMTEELKEVFLATAALIENEVTKDVLVIEDTEYYSEDPINYDDLFELMSNDFDGAITMYIEPYSKSEFPFFEEMKTLIKLVPSRQYYFEDIIPYTVLNRHPLQNKIKQYISDSVKIEVIETVISFIVNNMNSSQSAKKLYMHRNTLNYRIDNFIEKTHINVREFKGANAIYMLYRY